MMWRLEKLRLQTVISIAAAASILTMIGSSGGCAGDKKPATTQPTKLSDRTDKALADPFGYSPSFDRTDISGGDLGSFDKKGMDRDLNSVLNP